jgi:hypothetical protein
MLAKLGILRRCVGPSAYFAPTLAKKCVLLQWLTPQLKDASDLNVIGRRFNVMFRVP